MLGVSGCAVYFNPNRLPDGRLFPRHPDFTIIPYYDFQDLQLDFSSIYFWKRIIDVEGYRALTNYHYMRFWPTGECMYKSAIGQPIFEADSFDSAAMGFYNKSGSNIVFEIYSPQSYYRGFGFITSNEIHITRSELKYTTATFTYSNPEDLRFIRHYVGNLSTQPDWTPTGMIHRARQP